MTVFEVSAEAVTAFTRDFGEAKYELYSRITLQRRVAIGFTGIAALLNFSLLGLHRHHRSVELSATACLCLIIIPWTVSLVCWIWIGLWQHDPEVREVLE